MSESKNQIEKSMIKKINYVIRMGQKQNDQSRMIDCRYNKAISAMNKQIMINNIDWLIKKDQKQNKQSEKVDCRYKTVLSAMGKQTG